MCVAAENGFFWRWNSINKKESDWNILLQVEELEEWKEQIKNVMQHYVSKTDGSYIDI